MTRDRGVLSQASDAVGVPELADKYGEMEHIGPLIKELMSRPALMVRLSKFAGLLS